MLLQIALRKKASALTAVVTAAAIALLPLPAAQAQQKGPPVLRDTETEQLLREYTRPILRAAGLEKQNIQMVIINDGSFNAFVADGPPHLRQLRRDPPIGNAEPDHRRARARDGASGRRPSVQAA
ncbi:hypothetical protein ACVI3S_004360 [Bradyrhizobium diazoefficiens]